MTQEELLKIIKSFGAKIINESSFGGLINDTTIIERDLKFEVDDVEYVASWYCNLCTLYFGGLIIQFDNIVTSRSFPVRSVNQLHFYHEDKRVALLIKKYKDE